MNKLRGNVVHFREEGHLLQVQIALADAAWQVLLIDSTSARQFLQTNQDIQLIFKETSVILGSADCQGIGMQNRLLCTVHKVEEGALLSKVDLQHGGYQIAAIVPTDILLQLHVVPGIKVTAMVRANELILES